MAAFFDEETFGDKETSFEDKDNSEIENSDDEKETSEKGNTEFLNKLKQLKANLGDNSPLLKSKKAIIQFVNKELLAALESSNASAVSANASQTLLKIVLRIYLSICSLPEDKLNDDNRFIRDNISLNYDSFLFCLEDEFQKFLENYLIDKKPLSQVLKIKLAIEIKGYKGDTERAKEFAQERIYRERKEQAVVIEHMRREYEEKVLRENMIEHQKWLQQRDQKIHQEEGAHKDCIGHPKLGVEELDEEEPGAAQDPDMISHQNAVSDPRLLGENVEPGSNNNANEQHFAPVMTLARNLSLQQSPGLGQYPGLAETLGLTAALNLNPSATNKNGPKKN